MSDPFDTSTEAAIARREPAATLMTKAALTVDEAAQLFGESPDVIREAVWRGELPAERAGEAIVAIRRADLLAWMERRGGV